MTRAWRKWFDALVQRIGPNRTKIRGLILVDVEIGLTGIAPGLNRIPVQGITRVVAFKRDMVTSDLICFLVSYNRDDGTPWHVTLHEDLPGFLDVEKRLAQLPGFDQQWRQHVVLPPFATNETVIFDSEGRTDRTKANE